MKSYFLLEWLIVFMLLASSPVHAETQWKRGMWIGGLTGGVAVATTATVATVAIYDEEEDNSTPTITGAAIFAFLGGAAAGALIGGGIGAAIGSAFEKKNHAVTPLIGPDRYGLAWQASF